MSKSSIRVFKNVKDQNGKKVSIKVDCDVDMGLELYAIYFKPDFSDEEKNQMQDHREKSTIFRRCEEKLRALMYNDYKVTLKETNPQGTTSIKAKLDESGINALELLSRIHKEVTIQIGPEIKKVEVHPAFGRFDRFTTEYRTTRFSKNTRLKQPKGIRDFIKNVKYKAQVVHLHQWLSPSELSRFKQLRQTIKDLETKLREKKQGGQPKQNLRNKIANLRKERADMEWDHKYKVLHTFQDLLVRPGCISAHSGDLICCNVRKCRIHSNYGGQTISGPKTHFVGWQNASKIARADSSDVGSQRSLSNSTCNEFRPSESVHSQRSDLVSESSRAPTSQHSPDEDYQSITSMTPPPTTPHSTDFQSLHRVIEVQRNEITTLKDETNTLRAENETLTDLRNRLTSANDVLRNQLRTLSDEKEILENHNRSLGEELRQKSLELECRRNKCGFSDEAHGDPCRHESQQTPATPLWQQTLLEVGLTQKFFQTFEENGYDDIEFWPELTIDELMDLGLRKGHIRKWKRYFQKKAESPVYEQWGYSHNTSFPNTSTLKPLRIIEDLEEEGTPTTYGRPETLGSSSLFSETSPLQSRMPKKESRPMPNSFGQRSSLTQRFEGEIYTQYERRLKPSIFPESSAPNQKSLLNRVGEDVLIDWGNSGKFEGKIKGEPRPVERGTFLMEYKDSSWEDEEIDRKYVMKRLSDQNEEVEKVLEPEESV